MMSPVSRKLNAKQTLDEIRTVFMDELNYSREAEMADLFRRLNAGDDPTSTSRACFHSLTTKPRDHDRARSHGVGYQEFCEHGDQERATARAQTIWRFTFRSMLKYGVLYADPHPGNYRFAPDGRVTFLDFGCVKQLSPEMVAGMKRYMIAAMDADWHEFDRACVEVLGYDPDDESVGPLPQLHDRSS
jgi:predicted unusual protein kinase regulating ubiquinone biosynthesis (AarF/ABC1/UbiB family)